MGIRALLARPSMLFCKGKPNGVDTVASTVGRNGVPSSLLVRVGLTLLEDVLLIEAQG